MRADGEIGSKSGAVRQDRYLTPKKHFNLGEGIGL